MSIAATITPMFTHLLPILFFVYMLTDVLSRNRKKAEYLLVSGIIFCCLSMFVEEFVRHFLPISFSPILTAAWFSVSGITITGLGMHLFLKLTHLDEKFPRFVYPYLFYLPVVLVILNLFVNDQMVSGAGFHEVGIWKLPVYNAAYYIAMFGANIFNVFYIIILSKGIADTGERELRGIYKQLIFGVLVTAFFNLVIGTIDFKGYLPPYPYIYGSFLWCVLLRQTMKKYEFLNHVDIRYQKLFNVGPAAIVLTDMNGQVREANPNAKKLFQALDLDGADIKPLWQGELLSRIRQKEPIKEVALSVWNENGEIHLMVDGDYLSVEYTPHLILIVRDVTAQVAGQRELEFMAYHDTLTRLPNRKYFFERLNVASADARRNGESLAVMMFDLDLFKEINDQFGHAAGDQALVHVADAVRTILTDDDFAARFGGDEFIICLRSAVTKDQVKQKIGQLHKQLADHPLIVDGERLPVAVSIGISFFPGDGEDSDALLNSADRALYQVKRQGRNDYAFASKPG